MIASENIALPAVIAAMASVEPINMQKGTAVNAIMMDVNFIGQIETLAMKEQNNYLIVLMPPFNPLRC